METKTTWLQIAITFILTMTCIFIGICCAISNNLTGFGCSFFVAGFLTALSIHEAYKKFMSVKDSTAKRYYEGTLPKK